MATEDIATELYSLDEEEQGSLMVAEPSCRDLDDILSNIHSSRGAAFVSLLREITNHPAFSPLEGDIHIYTAGGESGEDYENQLNAARKAVDHGYRVFILPNPKDIRTADFVFERKGVYKMFDLKTIMGSNSADNRLKESVGQSNRVLLHIVTNYRARQLSQSIKHYFEYNSEAKEVLVFKGKKEISILREDTIGVDYYKYFMMKYIK